MELPVFDQHHRRAVEHLFGPPVAVLDARERQLEADEGGDEDEGVGDRVVLVRQRGLGRLRDDQQQDEIEGRHLGERAPPRDAEHEPEEEIRDRRADDRIHLSPP
ncbi:hypothetical protein D3C87_1923110 [compost metagenome]